jgi:predicted ATPase
MLTYIALTLASLGYIDQAQSWKIKAVSEARRISHVHTLTLVLAHANWLDCLTLPALLTEELLTLATEHGFPQYLGLALAHRGQSLISLGQVREGLLLVNQGLTELRCIGSTVNTPMLFTWLAEAYARLGQFDEARKWLTEAADVISVTDERYYEAELHRISGDLLSVADRIGAEESYRQAIAVAERQSAKLFQLRASVSLARLWCDQGKRAEARDLLGPIYHWFTEGFDAPDLKEAKALLDELA